MNETDGPQQETAEKPGVLYKYRGWDEHSKRSIEHLEVFFPSPRRFNDPFDCAIPPALFGSNEDENRARAARSVAQDMPGANRTDRLLETDARLKRFQKNSKNPKFRENWRREETRTMADTFGVLSLTTDPTSLLMWSYYADKHAGFCVGYDLRVLCETVNEVHKAYALSRVKYRKDIPDLRPEKYSNTIDLVVDMLRIKAKDWEHEQEYRLILDGKNEATIPLPKSAIAEVIVGARMPQNDVNEIAGFLERHGLSSALRRARLEEDKYAISIDPFSAE